MTTVVSLPRSSDQVVLYRIPQEPIAAREVLALHEETRTFSRLVLESDGSPRLVAGQAFAEGEYALLRHIVASYPEYCPFEDLLAVHDYGSPDAEYVAICRERLDIAQETNSWQHLIRPLYPMLSRIQFKVRDMGCAVGNMFKTGYLLQAMGPAYASVMNVPATESLISPLLRGILPTGHALVYNATIHMLTYLVTDQDSPRLLQERDLTNLEERVLLPILEVAPNYCSVQRLLASFTYGRITEETLARATETLEEAQQNGQWDLTMRPIRNSISRVRQKIRPMGLSLLSVLKTAYVPVYIGSQVSQRCEGGRHA